MPLPFLNGPGDSETIGAPKRTATRADSSALKKTLAPSIESV